MRSHHLLPVLIAAACCACHGSEGVDGDGGAGSDSDGDTDTDSDVDSDGDADSDTDPPEECDCPAGAEVEVVEDGPDVCIIEGEILEDQQWCPNNHYRLAGAVYVGDWPEGGLPVTLTIHPGTRILGHPVAMSAIAVQRGARIVAQGTPAAPIVFTSGEPIGTRSRGDWGGLMIAGYAPINGSAESHLPGAYGMYGGEDSADDSGIVSYVRFEFAGQMYAPEPMHNALTLAGVGSETTIENLHIHRCDDDGVEIFGGHARLRRILITGAGDDSFDWTYGWRGMAQFVAAQQYGDLADNGIEADNNGEDNSAEPYSDPLISNVTLVGVPDSTESDIGLLVREGTRGRIRNASVVGFNDHCLDVDDLATWDGVSDGDLSIERSVLDCPSPFGDLDPDDDPDWADLPGWFTAQDSNRVADPLLADPYETAAPDFRPQAGSPAGGAALVPDEPWFEPASDIGAVDSEDDWIAGGIAAGWIAFPQS